MSRIKIKALIILVSILAFVGFLLNQTKSNVSDGSILIGVKSQDVRVQREAIKKIINQRNAKDAYQLIKDSLGSDYTTPHNALHIFGEEIFRQKGEGAVSVCDSAFGYGCFHGLSVAALSQNGLDYLKTLEQMCKQANEKGELGCTHGLGHGVVEFVGRDNIVKALDICSGLSWKGKLYGCQGGVFMEYNFPNIFDSSESGSLSREYDPENPYEPCIDIPSKYKRACYYGLGQWLTAGNKDPKIVKGFCAGIADYYERRSCFLGIGSTLPNKTGQDPVISAEYCEQLSSLEGQTVCKSAVYNSLVASNKGNAELVCRGLAGEDLKSCTDYLTISELKE
jgi:hypothetical protein